MQDEEFGEATLTVPGNENVVKPIRQGVAPGILQFHHRRFPAGQGPVNVQDLPERGCEDHDVDVLGATKDRRKDIDHGTRSGIGIDDDGLVPHGRGGAREGRGR